MDINKKNHVIDAVFILCLMLLFVLSALCVITIGADIYKKNVAKMSENYSHRIACAYVTEKIRQSDNRGHIFVDTVFDKNALVLQSEVDDVLYNTYIYDYNGYLMELFTKASLKDFYPQSGQKIIEVASFDVEEISDSLLSVDIVLDDGTDETLFVAKRSSDNK